MLLKAVLSRAKYKIVTASGGYEAIEKASKEMMLVAMSSTARIV